MALKFPDGSIVGFATALAEPIPFTAISNGSPAVITHDGTIAKGGVLVVSSSWAAINNRVGAAGETTVGKTPLIGIDTTDPDLLRVGRGAGTVSLASTFINFSQQGELSSSGGEPQTYTGKWLEDPMGQEFQVPIGQSARQYSLQLDYDASMPWFEAAKAITRKRKPTVIRIQLPDGDIVYEYGYVHFNPGLNMQSGNPIKNAVNFYLMSSEGTLVSAP
ncbi:phage tail tube protein [Alcaligenes endophyticus]|uniref:Phage tail protein n=1 Tax=Alcaligenes endophyticus TaxID=1929088 RepID=A0ABT8EKS4_9BURK|nr:phage tail tube protein [Alcaligenes endophyticus]MCX5592025.1 phage tail tube protein [Alcaligenes endophyticus]MDN4121715.1 phage tail protein [Alcaligenes endophyticus]